MQRKTEFKREREVDSKRRPEGEETAVFGDPKHWKPKFWIKTFDTASSRSSGALRFSNRTLPRRLQSMEAFSRKSFETALVPMASQKDRLLRQFQTIQNHRTFNENQNTRVIPKQNPQFKIQISYPDRSIRKVFHWNDWKPLNLKL